MAGYLKSGSNRSSSLLYDGSFKLSVAIRSHISGCLHEETEHTHLLDGIAHCFGSS